MFYGITYGPVMLLLYIPCRCYVCHLSRPSIVVSARPKGMVETTFCTLSVHPCVSMSICGQLISGTVDTMAGKLPCCHTPLPHCQSRNSAQMFLHGPVNLQHHQNTFFDSTSTAFVHSQIALRYTHYFYSH